METRKFWHRQTEIYTDEQRRSNLRSNLKTLFGVTSNIRLYKDWETGLVDNGKAPICVFEVSLANSGLNLLKLCEQANDRNSFPERAQFARNLMEQQSQLRGKQLEEKQIQEEIDRLMALVVPQTALLPSYRIIVPATVEGYVKFVWEYRGGEQYEPFIVPSSPFIYHKYSGQSYLDYEYREVAPNAHIIVGKRNPFFRIQEDLKLNLHVGSYFSMGMNPEVTGNPPYPFIPRRVQLRAILQRAFGKI